MRQHLGARRGNYMMTMPFFLPVLIGFAALSIDISYINMAQSQVQQVADAASHAAFVGYRSTNGTPAQKILVGNEAAEYVVKKNLVGSNVSLHECENSGGTCDPNDFAKLAEVSYGEWDFSLTGEDGFDASSTYINSARVRVARNNDNNNPLDLFFAPILGHNTANVGARGVTAGRTRQIMIVQDVSCSFSGTNINNAKLADLAFLEYMNDNAYPGDKLGMSLFGGASWYPAMYDLTLVETDYSNMKAAFNKLDICYNLPSELRGSPQYNYYQPWDNTYWMSCNTSQARGLIQARDQFIHNGDPREFQAVIIVSDGLPTADLEGYVTNWSDAPGFGWWAGWSNAGAEGERAADQIWGVDANDADARSWDYTAFGCQGANSPEQGTGVSIDMNDSPCGNVDYVTNFDGGVHMWSVFFNNSAPGGSPTPAEAAAWMEDTFVKGMGRAYDTPDSSELAQIMVEIASSIPVVLTD